MFVGESNYCARVISDQEYKEITKAQHMFCVKFLPASLNETELRSKVVSLVIRVSVQLEQLGLLFLKKENTRIVHLQREIVLHFYLYHNNFYIATIPKEGFFGHEENIFIDMIQNIIQDTTRPLYTKFTQVVVDIFGNNLAPEYENTSSNPDPIAETFEVEEEEEPPYKKRRAETFSPLHQTM